jgi:uncharacterized RDD family membrane protein YckC
MSTAAGSLDLAIQPLEMETTTQFSPELLKAPFLLRCAAAFVDYMLLLSVPLLWLVLSKLLSDGPGGAELSGTVWLFVLIVWLINFLALPLLRGQTVGKMVAGISVVRTDGSPVRLGRILLRNFVGLLLTLVTLGLGFFVSAVNRSGRSLQDFLAGTVVVHARRNYS